MRCVSLCRNVGIGTKLSTCKLVIEIDWATVEKLEYVATTPVNEAVVHGSYLISLLVQSIVRLGDERVLEEAGGVLLVSD